MGLPYLCKDQTSSTGVRQLLAKAPADIRRVSRYQICGQTKRVPQRSTYAVYVIFGPVT